MTRSRCSSHQAGARRRVFEVVGAALAAVAALHQRQVGAQPPPGFTYRILPCIAKTGDSLLQEQLAIQLVRTFQDIFDASRLPLHLHAYSIVATGPEAGFVQTITDATSIDSLKRKNPSCPTLPDLFERLYGAPTSHAHRRATLNFCRSVAAWAVVCFLLQIKDRHNGNIMLHADGHVVHIDFGFLLSNSPGGNMNFESAPFKLTTERRGDGRRPLSDVWQVPRARHQGLPRRASTPTSCSCSHSSLGSRRACRVPGGQRHDRRGSTSSHSAPAVRAT